MRAPLYPAGIFPKQNDAARQVISAMRGGATLTTMGDLREWTGPSVDFFGRPAPSNTFPALMARTFSVPLFAGFVARVPKDGSNVRFRARMVEIPVPHTDDRDADVLAATAALQKQFEAFIREYPGQWMWAHRRWG
jgi:KDO2-lipid IV(A) lauroyltransferase